MLDLTKIGRDRVRDRYFRRRLQRHELAPPLPPKKLRKKEEKPKDKDKKKVDTTKVGSILRSS